MEGAKVGISSFGFAGSNAHVVITASKRSPAEPYKVPARNVPEKMEVCVKQLEMLSSTISPRNSLASETFGSLTIPAKNKDDKFESINVEDIVRVHRNIK